MKLYSSSFASLLKAKKPVTHQHNPLNRPKSALHIASRFIFLLGCCVGVGVAAQTVSHTDFTVPDKCKTETTVTLATASASVLLDFEVRLDPGSNHFLWPALEIDVNGTRVDPMVTTANGLQSRLVNKPLEYQSRRRGLVPWNWGAGWLVFTAEDFAFAAGFDAFWPPAESDQGQLFHFQIEVGDLMETGTNQVVFRNIATQWNGDLVFCGFSVVTGSTPAFSNDLPPVGEVAAGYTRDPGNTPFTFTVTETTAPRVSLNGETYAVNGRLIRTQNGGVETRDLVDCSNCWSDFRVDPVIPDQQWVLTATTFDQQLTLVRTFTKLGGKVTVDDLLTNHTATDMGVHLENRIMFAGTAPSPAFGILAGRQMQLPASGKQVLDELQPNHPSVFLQGHHTGLGLLATQDVARTHYESHLEPDAAVMGSHDLRVPANGSLSLHWVIYPADSPDYLPTMNRIREDWNLNYAMDGRMMVIMPTTAVNMDLGLLAERLKRNRVRYLVVAAVRDGDIPQDHLPDGYPWSEDESARTELHGHGFHYAISRNQGDNELTALVNQAAARVRSIDPNIKVLYYFNSFLTTENPATHNEEGHPEWYLYKHTYDPSEDEDPRYAYKLERVFFARYGEPNAANDPFRDQVLQPAVDLMLEHLDVDGIFWDLFSGANIHKGYHSPYSNSLEFFDNGETRDTIEMIKASAPFNRDLLNQIYDAGKFVITNEGAASHTLMEAAANHRVLNVHEDNLPHRISSGLLSTPLAFRIPEASPRHVMANMRHTVMFGMLYSTYVDVASQDPYNALEAIHPFEPRELHRGYLLGKNKIITVRPGNFGWDAAETDDIKVTLFDENGVARAVQAPLIERNGRLLVDLDLPWGHMAVLERQGLEAAWRFEEHSGAAVSGGDNAPSGTLNGGAGLGGNGRIGLGLSQDGTGSVALADDPVLQGDTFAVSAWVKPSPTAARQPLFGWDGDVGFDVAVTNGTRTMRVQLGPNYYHDFAAPADLFDGNFHHVVMAVDTGAGLASAAVFVDGKPMVSVGQNLQGQAAVRGLAAIGALANHRFHGVLDEVRFYNYVPSPAQAAALYRDAALVGAWTLAQDGADWSLADTSGYANHPVSNVPINPAGHFAPAPSGWAFDYSPARSDDLKVELDGSLLAVGHGVTVSAWINGRDLNSAGPDAQSILNLGDWNTTNQYFLGFYQNHLRFVAGDLWARGAVLDQSLLLDNRWYYLVGTADASGHRLYVDGVLRAQSDDVPGTMSDQNFDLFIGRLANSAGGRFDGLIAEPRVEMRALSSAEINRRYLDATLGAVWKLEETEGDTAFDTSGHAHHATFVNGTLSACQAGGGVALTIAEETRLHVADDAKLAAVPNADGSSGQLTLVVQGVHNAGASTADQTLFFKTDHPTDPNERGYYLVIHNSRLHIKHGDDKLWVAQDHSLHDGDWFHVAAIIDGGSYRMFLNGEEVPLTPTNLSGPSGLGADGLYLGGRNGGSWFQGKLVDARIYRGVLSPGMIDDLIDAANTTAVFPINRDGVVTGDDLSQNQHHGLAVDVTLDGEGHALFGPGGYVRVGHHQGLNPVGQRFTLSARIRWQGAFPVKNGVTFYDPVPIVSKGNWNECNYYGLLLTKNRLRFAFGSNWGAKSLQAELTHLQPDTWHTITAVVDGSYRAIFIDGNEVVHQNDFAVGFDPACQTAPCAENPAQMEGLPCNDSPLYIGDPRHLHAFKGNIEDVSIRQDVQPAGDRYVDGRWRLDGNGRGMGRLRAAADLPAAAFASGIRDLALDLEDSVAGTATVAHQAELNPSGDFTFSAWIKPETLDSFSADFGDTIVSKGDWNGDNGFLLGFYQGHLRFTAGQNWGAGLNLSIADSGVVPGQWFLVTAVREGNQLTLYINGQFKKSASPPAVAITTQHPLKLGSMGNVSRFDGLLDEVRYYRRALSAAEVLALWDADAPQ
ncbi:LamG domain-containing protein [Acanthopleuribacter pedis]|uniref:LamG-like jellyroll fold domain-containing protein n=1 Tax=Acanthopleuribacter pedis TaxID=442870 RepID=A0A8J7Q841_9BACT|nr:LamG domain-containing protein [Acanthopleuribacter pedis]MBO1319422.1 hypothetical protein [Acanthopleuribacter pedis]